MRKSLLTLLIVILCSLPSCVITVRMEEDTKQKVDAATTEVRRLNDGISSLQKDFQALVDEVQKLRNVFAPKKSTTP